MSPDTSVDNEGNDAGSERQTRRALMSSAVAGLQNFKQSWISVMLLKASIGLGQVIALLVLLILASTLASPLYPEQKQTTASPECPRPSLFIAWMSVNMARLVVCWLVSCWMLVRNEQRRRRRARRQAERRALEDQIAIRAQEQRHLERRDREAALCQAARSSEGSGGERASCLVGNEMEVMSDNVQARRRGSAEMLNASTSTSASSVFCGQSPEVGWPDDPEKRLISLDSKGSSSGHDTYALPVLNRDAPTRTDTTRPAILSPASPQPSQEEEAEATGFAAWLDRHALNISKSLGVISTILFILGNVLLFYPTPSPTTGCYAASPMLWWGVMVVVGVGWVLFAQVFFVAVIVGLGGHVVFKALRKMGILAEPPVPEPPRTPQPDPLTPAELHSIRVVCFLPPTPTSTINDNNQNNNAPPRPDISRLPYPPVYLADESATCAICQENFQPPAEGRTIMLRAEPLRQLGCGHVFHTSCIDQWLLKGSANCPFCKRSVRDDLSGSKEMTSVPSSGSASQPRITPGETASGPLLWARRATRIARPEVPASTAV